MFDNDHQKGKAILIFTFIIFLYYTIWVIGLPFVDDDKLKSFFCSYNLALMIPASCGLIFIGSLILFTTYHVKPYLSVNKIEKMK